MDSIRLDEYTTSRAELTPEDAAFVRTQLKKKISITRDPLDDVFLLNPAQYVGVVTLPSGRRIECYPKVDVRNLFHMIAVALDNQSSRAAAHLTLLQLDVPTYEPRFSTGTILCV